ncbi:MAG: DnaJ domain-containing protein [Cyanobacteria bacterium P01_A01_bin.123]
MPQGTSTSHYHTLDVSETATQAEIKQAYRRLVKKFHPDSRHVAAGHEQITQINAAYEILGDPQNRSRYDQERQYFSAADAVSFVETDARDRQQRTVDSQNHYRQRRKTQKNADIHIEQWLKHVYSPIDRLMGKILSPLKTELRSLSADPFDDELMEGFQAYLENCRSWLEHAQGLFKSMASPANAAGVAMDLYHCLNQLEDGIDEMERFTYSYEESYLHTGQELFRLVTQLRKAVKAEVRSG